MKKVLHLIWRFEGGGIESFCINLLKAIDTEEYHFDFAVCGNELPAEKDFLSGYDCRIYHLPLVAGKRGKREYLAALDRVLSENRYDAVHSHLAFLNISTLKLAKRHNIPKRISHVHVAGYGRPNSPKTILKRFLANLYSTHCIACSQDSADFYYGRHSRKSAVLYSGIDMSRYQIHSDKDSESASDEILICGRLAPEKNAPFILRIIEEMTKLNANIQFKWLGVSCHEVDNLINRGGATC